MSEPSCRFVIDIVWADGETSSFEGTGLTPRAVAETLPKIAEQIREHLHHEETGDDI